MKLTHIDAQNVLGITAASVAIATPVTLFSGPNGNGKSSLAEAVRMALGGDVTARGVALKKDLAALVHEGAKSGSVEVQLEGGLVTFALVPSGKTTPAEAYVPHKALAFVLEPHRFATLDANERRSMLFELMGLKITPAEVAKRLEARGVDKDKAARVGPLLKAGFDAACAEAKRKGTEAKGAWRAVTGETYGGVKAEGWKAPTVPHDAAGAKNLATELQHSEVALEQWQKKIGALEKDDQRRASLRAKMPALTEAADKIDRILNKLTADESGLAEWEQRLQATTAEAGNGRRVGLVHDLASAIAHVLPAWPNTEQNDAGWQVMRDALDAYEREHGKLGIAGNPEAQAKLPDVRKSRDLMAGAVANGKRDLEAAKRADAELEAIDTELATTFDADGLTEAREHADKLKTLRAELVKKLDVIKAQKVAADAAEKKTTEAAHHHADVVAWDLIAAGLAPDGIPGQMLAEALAPFNERLAQSSNDTEWMRVGIDADMSITAFDGRPYKLLSESEKWRADAMLAEAISHLSGLKLLLLDRVDVLDLKGRSDLFAWLEILAGEGELETALLFATLKGLPAGLAACVTAHWLQDGQIQQFKTAA
jgi:ABC-type amino acid transport substrate-binding protein